jgi:hypothetical protein
MPAQFCSKCGKHTALAPTDDPRVLRAVEYAADGYTPTARPHVCPAEQSPAESIAQQLPGMTPAEVDTLAAPFETALGELVARMIDKRNQARDAERQPGRFAAERAARLQAEAEQLDAKVPAALAACEPFRAEYDRRGGWSRIIWCTANGGHAHRGRQCPTLRPTTGVVWLPELSGTDEAALVELAGASACTVCYPSAPVDVLARPSRLRPAVEEREAREARQREQEAKRAAKAAKGITAPDGSPLRVDGSVIASEVTARNEYVSKAAEAADHAEGLTGWGHRPDLAERYAGHAAQLLAALAHKHGRTVEEEAAELAGKVTARRKRDARERARYAAQA